jgi:hypothetical protein
MELENNTQLEAALLRGDLPDGERTLAVVVAKASAVIDPTGRMALDLSLRTPICHEPVAHPDGQIPADLAPRKQGFDVLALGEAYHPALEGGGQSEVAVRVHDQRRTLRVFGERHWYRSHGGDWCVTPPQPFSLLSLSFLNAYGGSSFDPEGRDCPYPLNLDGKGYVACEEAIEGTPLPNLEDPEQLIQSWRDQPRPCSLAPASRQLAVDPEQLAADQQRAQQRKEPFRVPAALWNDAVPRFRFEAALPGAAVSLSGMSEEPIQGALPELQLWADVLVGVRELRVPLVLDTLLWLPAERRALFTFRGSFTYRFVPRETRRVRLTLQG